MHSHACARWFTPAELATGLQSASRRVFLTVKNPPPPLAPAAPVVRRWCICGSLSANIKPHTKGIHHMGCRTVRTVLQPLCCWEPAEAPSPIARLGQVVGVEHVKELVAWSKENLQKDPSRALYEAVEFRAGGTSVALAERFGQSI